LRAIHRSWAGAPKATRSRSARAARTAALLAASSEDTADDQPRVPAMEDRRRGCGHSGARPEEEDAPARPLRLSREGVDQVDSGHALRDDLLPAPGGPEQAGAVRDSQVGSFQDRSERRVGTSPHHELRIDGHDLARRPPYHGHPHPLHRLGLGDGVDRDPQDAQPRHAESACR